MQTIIEIETKAKGKGRPRAALIGGRVVMYTPRETKVFEQLIVKQYKRNKGNYFGNKPIAIEIVVCTKIPTGASKQKKDDMLKRLLLPDKKPDLDNIIKAVLDALNGVAYEDDKQIVSIQALKYYAEKDNIKIIIRSLENTEEDIEQNTHKIH